MKNTLQCKYPGTLANRTYEQLSYPKNPKMCDPILVTLLKMQPHYSQSSRENATPSSGTSPLALYTEVPPRPSPRSPCRPKTIYYLFWIGQLIVKSSFKRRTEVFSFYIIEEMLRTNELLCNSRLLSFLYIVFCWNNNLSYVLASQTQQ